MFRSQGATNHRHPISQRTVDVWPRRRLGLPITQQARLAVVDPRNAYDRLSSYLGIRLAHLTVGSKRTNTRLRVVSRQRSATLVKMKCLKIQQLSIDPSTILW